MLLKINQKILIKSLQKVGLIEKFLGSGFQGEVYQIKIGKKRDAVKCFSREYLNEDKQILERLERIITSGPPSNRFLWPLELVTFNEGKGVGYLMPLREHRFKSFISVMRRREEPNYRVLLTSAFELADSFLRLHSKGLCYRDISFNNIFFDPKTGEIRICDNDNVDVSGKPGYIAGTPRFMAPQIVRRETFPSTESDLFSLAVLLFYLLFMHHPLEGKKELEIKCMDLPAMQKIYGTEPIFIFDPENETNRPVQGYHDNAIILWVLYPYFIKDLFIRAFTEGLHDLKHKSVRESEWRQAMIRLKDSIVLCGHCGSENFYDFEAREICGNRVGYCWACRNKMHEPVKIRIGRNLVVLNHDTIIYSHHIDSDKLYDFSERIAEVVQHPQKPEIWGFKNLTESAWKVRLGKAKERIVYSDQSIRLENGLKINFGKSEGEIYI